MANDFLPFAITGSPNVVSQATYAASTELDEGFSTGVAESAMLNKAWRQSSVIAAVIGQYIEDLSGDDALDDGDIATLLASYKDAVTASANAASAIGLRKLKITTSGTTWVAPAGVTTIYVTGSGGGAGGGGSGSAVVSGANGGTTTITSGAGTALTLAGGYGGIGGSPSVQGLGGAAGGGLGFEGYSNSAQNNAVGISGAGGGIGGGAGVGSAVTGNNATANSGAGGSGAGYTGGTYFAGGGGGSGELCQYRAITVVPGDTYTFTFNAGGAGGAGSAQTGGNGAAGYAIIEW